MQKITSFLWFDNQAEEAMNFYTSLFKNSKVESIKRYPQGPLEGPMKGMEGKVITGVFELAGQRFMALDGGPTFQFTPAISFFVNCETEKDVDALWEKLSVNGTVLMELAEYPFSKKFGWLNDRFGLSWQLMLAGQPQKIFPFLLFVGEQHGKAEEAINFYTSVFKNTNIITIERYGPGQHEPEGTVMHARFTLNGQEFMAMESGFDHQFTFTPATSFYVECHSQEEVDYFWEKLSQGGDKSAKQCGWLKDKYGVSWQIIPTALPELLNDPDPEKSQRAMQAMLQMKKIDIKALRQAYEQP